MSISICSHTLWCVAQGCTKDRVLSFLLVLYYRASIPQKPVWSLWSSFVNFVPCRHGHVSFNLTTLNHTRSWNALYNIDYRDPTLPTISKYFGGKKSSKQNQAIGLDQLIANVSHCTNVNGKLLPTGSILKRIDSLGNILVTRNTCLKIHRPVIIVYSWAN